MTRLRNLVLAWRRVWGGLSFAALVLAWGCGGDVPAAVAVRTSTATLECFERVKKAMLGATGCAAKIHAADLVAQTEPACSEAKMTELGLVCPDGGAP